MPTLTRSSPTRRPAATEPEHPFVRGAATTLVLATLAEHPRHGYELMQTIRQRSEGVFDFSEGTIYPLLYGLRDRGWLRSVRQTSETGRDRKVYHLTAAGRAALADRLSGWKRFSRGMERTLENLA